MVRSALLPRPTEQEAAADPQPLLSSTDEWRQCTVEQQAAKAASFNRILVRLILSDPLLVMVIVMKRDRGAIVLYSLNRRIDRSRVKTFK